MVAVSLLRPPPRLAVTLARIGQPSALVIDDQSGTRHQILLRLGRALWIERVVTDAIRTDLRGSRAQFRQPCRARRDHRIECGLLPPVVTAILAAGGIGFPVALPAGLAVTFVIWGASLPNLVIHCDAERQCRAFKYALGAYLDLVSINLAA